jgi:hypothetical protein
MEVSKYWKWTCFVLFVIISIWTFKDFWSWLSYFLHLKTLVTFSYTFRT